MKKVLTFAGLALLALTGCTSYYTERGSQAQLDPWAITPDGYRSEWAIAEQRTSAKGSARVLFWVFTSGDAKYANVPGCKWSFWPSDRAVNLAKAAATYNACEKSNADALLGVAYKYKVTDYFFTSTVECEVVGFPANVTALKFPESKPILLTPEQKIVRLHPWETLEDYTGKTQKQEDNDSVFGKILSTFSLGD